MTLKTCLAISGLLLIVIASCDRNLEYLDTDFPGTTPKIYAVGIVNQKERFQQNLTMSLDGKEQLFTITDSKIWRYERILRVRNLKGKIQVDTPDFVKEFKYKNEWFIGEPMISPDNKNLVFIADYPPDLWISNRNDKEEWGSTRKTDRHQYLEE